MAGSGRGRQCVWIIAGGVLAAVVIPAVFLSAGQGAPDSDQRVVADINQRVAEKWASEGVRPSPRTEDGEFLRRVYLDVVGHIPPVEAAERFLKDRDRDKRAEIVQQLLESEGYVNHWTTIWANLLIGRSTPERVSRDGLENWLRKSLAANKRYDEFVYELIAATGEFNENGAVNYLLAHLNDQATPATGRTARLFLGMQIQCTQCHDHPFNDWQQEQFWQLNAFFRQAQRRDSYELDRQSGQREFVSAELVNSDFSGPVYFERRSALMSVAFPVFFDGAELDDGPGVDRRTELARWITDPVNLWMARALVNRMWGHFFGYGFTKPVDDMGPHNPPTHPELLDQLAQDFVDSGYDVKRLIRWITASDAYQLASRMHRGNEKDDPAEGARPLFAHMYVKQMTAEQLYDSLLVATQAHRANAYDWPQAEEQRRQWLRQFVVVFGTDENDETTTFNGTIPQSLMMMNGELVRKATEAAPGTFLHQVLNQPTDDAAKIRTLYLATLCREPTPREISDLSRIVALAGSGRTEAFQDVFWALLNSNEFILNH